MSTEDPAVDQRVDEAIRAQHARSLEHLSPRVRAQLQQRRRAALAGQAREASRGWRFALPLAAAAAVGAIVVGVQLRNPDSTTAPQVAVTMPAPSVSARLAHVAAPANVDENTDYASLDESPDLYVWLASDGATLAME
jgi:anti-sigma-K factor RskA